MSEINLKDINLEDAFSELSEECMFAVEGGCSSLGSPANSGLRPPGSGW